MDELTLTPPSGLQPEISISKEERKQEDELVDDLLQRAILAGDPTLIFGHVRGVMKVGRRKAYGVARAVYLSWKEWDKFRQQGIDDDWENVAPAMCALSLDQLKNYRDIYLDIFMNPEVPEFAKDYLVGSTMRTQYALLSPARDSLFTEKDWKEVTNAVTEREVKGIVRRVKKTPVTSSETRVSIHETDDHRIRAKQGSNGKYVEVAVLRASDEDLIGDDYEHRVRRIAVERIRRNAGILGRKT